MEPEGLGPERRVHFVVTAAEAGCRLDLVTRTNLPGTSRAVIQRLIRDGHVTVDGKPAKASTPVAAGSAIDVAVPPVPSAAAEGEDLPLTLMYEDADLAVIDKPAGMVVHPAAGHPRGTVVNALIHRLDALSAVGGRARPGIVHRLDKGTSGLMVVAKHDRAHRALSKQFHDRTVGKSYIALVWGQPPSRVEFDTPIGRDPRNRLRMSSRAVRGRPASTVVERVEGLGSVALLTVGIHTGRTHQIRVHLAEAGFPVAGDALYGGARTQLPGDLAPIGRLDRPFLHAAHLEFRHPADERAMVFDAPLPADLASILADLRRNAEGRARPKR